MVTSKARNPNGRLLCGSDPDWRKDDIGAVAIEYALIAGMIALVIIGALVSLGESLISLPLQSIIDGFVEALS